MLIGPSSSQPNKDKKLKSKSSGESKKSSLTEALAKQSSPQESRTFETLLKVELDNKSEQIQSCMRDLEESGRDLEVAPDILQFERYKNAVRKLLALGNHAFEVQKSEGRLNPRTLERKEFHVVEIIDRELESLLAMVREREKDRLAIASTITQIKGLVLDLHR